MDIYSKDKQCTFSTLKLALRNKLVLAGDTTHDPAVVGWLIVSFLISQNTIKLTLDILTNLKEMVLERLQTESFKMSHIGMKGQNH